MLNGIFAVQNRCQKLSRPAGTLRKACRKIIVNSQSRGQGDSAVEGLFRLSHTPGLGVIAVCTCSGQPDVCSVQQEYRQPSAAAWKVVELWFLRDPSKWTQDLSWSRKYSLLGSRQVMGTWFCTVIGIFRVFIKSEHLLAIY